MTKWALQAYQTINYRTRHTVVPIQTHIVSHEDDGVSMHHYCLTPKCPHSVRMLSDNRP